VAPEAAAPGGVKGSADAARRRVLVVDDHALVQMGVRTLLAQQPWVERCLSTGTVEQALELTARYEPHLALVDLFIGSDSGVELCRRLKRVRPSMAIMFMSGGGRIAPAVARAAGAVGFVSKSWEAPVLLEAVHRALMGRVVFEAGAAPPPKGRLTERELDVLRAIAGGASNPEVAEQLQLSPHTVKQYTSSLYRKLDARNRTEAVRCAQRLGLIY
jgi:DNA-binding NarL/FixJ family response regulator